MSAAITHSTIRPGGAIAGRKLQSLDGLRAIAIILVFFTHVSDLIPTVNLPTFYFKSYLAQGWMGVDLFFVLSGFLITGILLDTREAGNYFTGFYARRILRIFPLYYLVLTTVLIAGSLLHSPSFTAALPLPADRWLYYTYLMNWLGLWKGHWSANYLAHFWSLAVEEQFYLVWPLVVWMVRPRGIPWVAGALALLSVITRLVWVAHSGAQVAIGLATISRLDALFIGALCACLFRVPERMIRVRKWLPWVAALGIGSFYLVLSGLLFFPERALSLLYGSAPAPHALGDVVMRLMECGGYTTLALGFGALVLLVAHTEAAHTEAESTRMQRFLQSRFLRPIGIYSYGIYVFHVPIIGATWIFVISKVLPRVRTFGDGLILCGFVVLLAAVTFIVSALSYELFEKRILGLKRNFAPQYAPASCDALAKAAVAD